MSSIDRNPDYFASEGILNHCVIFKERFKVNGCHLFLHLGALSLANKPQEAASWDDNDNDDTVPRHTVTGSLDNTLNMFKWVGYTASELKSMNYAMAFEVLLNQYYRRNPWMWSRSSIRQTLQSHQECSLF